MEAPVPASTRASNLGSATRLFVTECAVAHCLQKDMVFLPPQGLTSGGGGGRSCGMGPGPEVYGDKAQPPLNQGELPWAPVPLGLSTQASLGPGELLLPMA